MAHVKNEETQEWWRFDDETTSLMKHGPVGEAGDHGVQATVTAPGKVTRSALCCAAPCPGIAGTCIAMSVLWHAYP